MRWATLRDVIMAQAEREWRLARQCQERAGDVTSGIMHMTQDEHAELLAQMMEHTREAWMLMKEADPRYHLTDAQQRTVNYITGRQRVVAALDLAATLKIDPDMARELAGVR